MSLNAIKKDLETLADKSKIPDYQRFFKTKKGEYAEGDKFIGINVPNQRIIAKKYKNISLQIAEELLQSNIHEHRLTALLIFTYKFPKSSEEEQKEIITIYLKNTKYINNWDLVDLSAPKLLGEYFLRHSTERSILYKFASSKNLWEKRIAMLSTYTFIKKKSFDYALKLAEILINDKHDLIHKAVGWMLREIGKINQETEEAFLLKYYKTMPRTMLRYAIEKFSEKKRKFYLEKL